MVKKNPSQVARVKVSYSNCTLLSSEEMECPLCHITVPPYEEHHCSKAMKEVDPK